MSGVTDHKYIDGKCHEEGCQALVMQATISRLEADRDHYRSRERGLMDECSRRDDEIEKLTKELAEAREANGRLREMVRISDDEASGQKARAEHLANELAELRLAILWTPCTEGLTSGTDSTKLDSRDAVG